MAPIDSYREPSTTGRHARTMRYARGVLGGVEKVLLNFAVISILALGAVILSSVLLREFGFSGVSDEVVIVGELMIGALVLPLAFLAAENGFIAVEVFTARFGPRAQLALNLLATVVGLIAVAPIAYAAFFSMIDAISEETYFFGLLELPEWPGRVVFFIGYLVFFIRLIDLAVYETLILCGAVKPRTRSSARE